MPTRPAATAQFRRRFDDLEERRKLLLAQLRASGDAAAKHPGYRNALVLLNSTFRRASLTQRVAILEAAAWLIELLEKLPAV